MTPASGNLALPIDGFLSWLRRQGFIVGVDSHLRVQELLSRIGPECAPGELKTLLCPLFATNPEQQEIFYTAFDAWFTLLIAPSAPPENSDHIGVPKASIPETSKSDPFQIRKRLLAGVGAALLLGAIIMWVARPTNPPEPPPVAVSDNLGKQAEPPAQLAPQVPPMPPDDLSKRAGGTQPEGKKTEQSAQPKPVPKPPVARSQPSPLWWAGVLGPWILYVAYEVVARRRRRLALKRLQGKRPPHSWPIRMQTYPRAFHSPQFYTAARRLQSRHEGETVRLDVGASIHATVQSLGFPALQYKAESRLPEYLVLIDRASFRDHPSCHFETLGKALQNEGLFLTMLFFDGDPRVCWYAGQDKQAYLVDLEQRFSGHRLLLFTDGEKLIDSVNGRLADWTMLFSSWEDRARSRCGRPASGV